MALRFLVDEDFDNDILRGVLRRLPTLDIVRVQDFGLSGAIDPVVLEWSAKEGRIVFTHDVSTMSKYAMERVQHGLPMPGVFAVPQSLSIGKAIDEIMLIAECSHEGEWEGQFRFLPL
ncbi:MAG: DUF5615 family PIN-like protein [Gemmataceae bacterium]|nr:DUF5615 family PIN-like protein [Gemmataceae bacterium]MCI0743137.1 DUF5615 family PIN-like protein [Gemmataceae bacterium]